MTTSAPLLLAVLSSLASTAAAATLTVSNPADLQSAVSRAAPGDVIVMRDGSWPDTAIRLACNGAEGKPITLKAATPGKVILTGASSLDFAGDWLVVDGLRFDKLNSKRTFVVFEDGADSCRLSNSAILDSQNGPGNWIHMRRGVSNRIDHCRFSGMNQPGLTLQVETETNRPNHHLIDNNFFGHRARGTGNGFETIRIGYSHQQRNYSGTTVASNLFHQCDGENEIISNKATGNRLLRNTFRNNRGELTLRHGDKARVEGNWFLADNTPGSGGVRIIGADHVVINNYFSGLSTYAILIRNGVATTDPKSYTQVTNALVAFNTITDCNSGIVVGNGAGTLLPADCTIANNIIHCPNGTLIRHDSVPTNFVYEANILLGPAPDFTPAAATGFTFADPKLVADADGIRRPAADSPARNAASQRISMVTADISGNPRAGTRDIGAQVLSPAARIGHPLTDADVGPSWLRNTR